MKVYMISEPYLRWETFVDFLTDEGLEDQDAKSIALASAGPALAEIGGRVCYMSFGKGRKTNKEYLDNIIKQKHFSIMEHANWTFIITGVSRSFTHELVRHRHLSFSQLSQRYVDESHAEAIIPPALEGDAHLLSTFNYAFDYAKGNYIGLVAALEQKLGHIENDTERRKAARQAARAILPNAIETKIVVTGNARAWREFIEKRNSPHADPEIRRVAQEILSQLKLSAANLFSDLKEE